MLHALQLLGSMWLETRLGRSLDILGAGLGAVFVAIFASCSFDSRLDGANCDESREGDRVGNQVCRDGYWVPADPKFGPDDTGSDTASDLGGEDGCVPSPETCNGADDDCDGSIDEGEVCTCDYMQNEKGVCEESTQAADGSCERPPAYNETEVRCSDGKDNDCDGETDDNDSDCDCSGTAERSCYTGPNNTKGVGICAEGTQKCRNGRWGPCTKQTTPDSGEICGDQKDNDCDGTTDNGCSCTYDPDESKNTDTNDSHSAGVCENQTLDSNGSCTAPGNFESRTDNESKCSGGDEDCDGAVDEGCSCTFDPFEPAAADTDQSHNAGVCTGQTRDADGRCKRPSSFETRTDREMECKSLDDDCDGTTDEGCSCNFNSNSKGVCGTATIDTSGTCASPNGYDSTDKESSANNCDTRDNDCDGATDEGCSCDYKGLARGVCGTAALDSNGSCVQPSTYEKPTDSESNCNGNDNDCDGVPDEGCGCNFKSTSTGICGTATKDATGSCAAPPAFNSTDDESAVPACDGLDNDCDGTTDEGCPCDYNSNPKGVCGTATNDASGTCQEPSGFDSTDNESSAGNCDQLDNDCDGATDEGCTCDYNGTPTGVCGGSTRDSSGSCQKPGNHQKPEIAACNDGLDNDCDGTTDESPEKRATKSCTNDCECISGECHNQKCAHRIFVTSETDTYNGDLGGLSGADDKCRAAANAENLSGTWKAVLSDSSTNASDRLRVQARVIELDGDTVADQSNFWSDSHSETINIAPSGSAIDTSCGSGDCDHVWTGSQTDGTFKSQACSDWGSGDSQDSGDTGDANQANSDWIEQTSEDCADTLHLYCIDGQF